MKPLNELTEIGLRRRLNRAYTSCKSCGLTYGTYSVGCSSTWRGRCDVCGCDAYVTEARDYGYFAKTLDTRQKPC